MKYFRLPDLHAGTFILAKAGPAWSGAFPSLSKKKMVRLIQRDLRPAKGELLPRTLFGQFSNTQRDQYMLLQQSASRLPRHAMA
ncbi:hypothetical protein KCP69_10215 [Salmonella enterica subsp. enterica]|nr:hypothetical protein KCP69_10215 [Salmonella enterica subsp. enterica]